jgi:hypothetical protein
MRLLAPSGSNPTRQSGLLAIFQSKAVSTHSIRPPGTCVRLPTVFVDVEGEQ